MRAHCLQHVPFEGLGNIEPWLASAGAEIAYTRMFEAAELPGLDRFDLLVVMGGPMSVNDEERFPWLVREKEFLRTVIDAGKPVFGVCLGAQLIASAMGARVYKNREPEIGWFPVHGVASEDPRAFAFPIPLRSSIGTARRSTCPTGQRTLRGARLARIRLFSSVIR